jgi:hypothetical protein
MLMHAHGPPDALDVFLFALGAVGAAVGSAAPLAEIPGRADWALTSFAATVLYLLGASIQPAFVAGR